MPQKDALIAELKNEGKSTRKILEKTPQEKFDWKPHEKSMTLGRLAAHIAEIPVWVNRCFEGPVFDFASVPFVRNTYQDSAELLRVFEEKQAAAIAALEHASDDMLAERFTIQRGGQVVYQMPRKVLIRNFAYNHLVHHR